MFEQCCMILLFQIFILELIIVSDVTNASTLQAKNVALNKPVEVSSLQTYVNGKQDPAVVVDGSQSSDPSSCISTALNDPNPWIQVDLLSHYRITSVNLRNRNPNCKGCDSNFNFVYVEVHWDRPAANDTGKGQECYFYQRTMPPSAEENLECYKPVSGRYIRVYKIHINRYTLVTLCELRVFGEKKNRRPKNEDDPNANRALHKLVEASSKFWGSRAYLDNVVDGSDSSEMTSCYSTAKQDDFTNIQVDLVHQYRIHRISLRNSVKPCSRCANNFKNVYIEVYKSKPPKYVNGKGDECYFYNRKLPFGQEETVQCKIPVVGRFVRVYKSSKPRRRRLILCELKVFGERADQPHKKASVAKQSLLLSLRRKSVCECAVMCGQHPGSTGFKLTGRSCSCILLLGTERTTGRTGVQVLNFHHGTGSLWVRRI